MGRDSDELIELETGSRFNPRARMGRDAQPNG